MTRRTTVIALSVFLVVGIALFAYTQLKKSETPSEQKQFVIGVLNTGLTLTPIFEGLKEGLQARGYTEGAAVEYLLEDNLISANLAKAAAEQFIAQKVDLIIALGIVPAKAAQIATEELAPTLPVFIVSSDPVGNNLVLSINEPGGNITGVTPGNETISGRRVELIKQLVPSAQRIIYPYNNSKTAGLEEIKSTAESLHLEVVAFEIKTPDELEIVLSDFTFRNGDVLMRATDSVLAAAAPIIAKMAKANRVPLIGNSAGDATRGSVMAYGADYHDLGLQGARLVEKILRGGNPGKIPIELPEHFVIAVNLGSAKELGITIPDAFLHRANIIIPAK
ncbi:hypothetical protein A2671_01010 [Candidatus Kaiserbacteria bacterium RIFCSPHIGHO2_01_FULL_49_13]|uniref:ABC transporter substrate-binding protein n=1 Tax=Candidatus Kaiserbacteria bacterium RIFCSPHIGHO2_01_FULL_49_13 TaxID=1798477 RepID=A0A1F6CFL8_9BACT|nr:MAG: hypothetical protein A2671_01010 [Candidatus Kaiserbacteria bacterium RIFCSPHIGHO2_01_FULL_49_13]